MDWNLILTILSVITILISGSVYVVVLITKVTTRVRDTERDILDQKERIKNLEDKTSFENLEKVTQKVLTQAIHSKEFKESMRDVILHVSKNHYAAENGVMIRVLEVLEGLEAKK
jgi:hypothetical protein